MSSVDEQVALFSDLTGCPPDQAQFFLQSAGGNLELAVNEFFLSQEEGAPMDEGSDGEDEGEDGYDDEDAEMDMPPLIPVSPSAPGAPPPSKRPKVEMRQAPSLPGASAEQLMLLQQVFGLAAKPKDAADQLHRDVKERMHSWAYNADRGLPYLLSCFKRLPAATTGGRPFALDCVLHHTRAVLLSGETSDEGLELFEERSEGGELGLVLKVAEGSDFLAAANESMTAAEQDQVFSPMLEEVFVKLAAATVVVGMPTHAPGTAAPPGWREAVSEAELLLGLVEAGGALKAVAHGAAARQVLARRLRDEAALLRKGTWSARDAETHGALRLLAAAPAGLPTGVGAKRGGQSGGHHEDESVTAPAQHEVWGMQTRLRLLLTAALIKAADTRALALEWVAAVLQANVHAQQDMADIAAAGPEAAMRAGVKTSGEGCMLNLATMLLQLCEPFCTPSAERNGKGHDGFARLDPAWLHREQLRAAVATRSRRREPTLRLDAAHDSEVAGGDAAELGKEGDFEMAEKDVEDEDELAQAIRLSLKAEAPPPPPVAAAEKHELARPTTAQSGHRTVADPAGRSAEGRSADHSITADTEFHFVTECFFLALRALQVALVPATKRAEKILHDFSRKAKVPPLHAPTAHAASEALKQLQLAGLGQLQHVLLAYRVTLEGEQLQALLLRFLSLAAAWLLHLGETEGAPAKFALLPEACVTGICELLIVTARTAPQRLAGHPAAAAIVSRFCCDWLGRRELLASPFVRYTMADVLSTLIEADSISRQSGHGAMRLFDLVDAPAAERVQAPLMGLYVELGLHTNASAVTDKNGQRYNLMRVLRKLWEMPRAWQQLQSLARQSVSVPAGEQEAGSGSGSGGGSASSAGAGTGAPSAAQVASFGEFCSTLVKEMIFLLDDALGRLTDVKSRQDEMTDEAAWNAQPARQRAERERRLEQVKRTAKGFLDLAKASLAAMLHLTADPAVVLAFTGEPARARKVANLLGEFLKRLCGPKCQGLKVQQGEKLGWQPKVMLTHTTQLLLSCTPQPGFVQALRDADSVEPAILAKAHAILASKCNFPPTQLDALMNVTGQLQQQQQQPAAAGDLARTFAHVTEAEAAEPTANLLQRLEGTYVDSQRPLAFDEVAMEGSVGYEHYYHQNISDSPQEGTPKAKMKRLGLELRKLAEEGSLPVSAESAIYVMRDEARVDVLKVLISGPADALHPDKSETPYALGLFEFHLFVPQDYPNVSPLVNLQTTGDGLVRFNPNLYSDGKVCLSLLGTWHGEGWMPPTAGNSGSTILQVLVSIQSIIMVPKPYFNEPGYAEEEGTPAGEQRSREYNDNLRAATLRHAVRDMLRRPPAGFEAIVRSHFRLLRPLLERQIKRWVTEAQTDSTREGMLRTYAELRPLLDKLDADHAAAAVSGASGTLAAATDLD